MRDGTATSGGAQASLRGVVQICCGLHGRFQALPRVWTLGLVILPVVLLQFLQPNFGARTTDCYRGPFPPDERPAYFPAGAFGVRGPFTASLYACSLRAMGESPLIPPATASAAGTYRLTVIPTWGAPFVVRLAIATDGSGTLTKKAARSQVDAATLTIDTTQYISSGDVGTFDSFLSKADFWSIPTILMSSNPRMATQVMGGVVWILEGAKPGAYHVVTRTLLYTSEPGPYEQLTSYLFKDLAHFDVPPPPVPSRTRRR